MRRRLQLFVRAVALPALVLGVALSPRDFLAGGPHLFMYVLANLVVFLDFVDLLVRLHFRSRNTLSGAAPTSVPLDVGEFTPYQIRLHLRPYALLVSVHDAEEDIDDFLEAMEPYRERLWVIDDASTDDTWFRLQQARVHAVRGSVNRRKPGAIRELLSQLPAGVATVVVLDPDARIRDSGSAGGGVSDLERVIFEFQRSGMAAVCPRLAVRQDGWLARLQALEYTLAFSLGRKSLGDHSITSGIAIYRRDALALALENHTLSVYAEDLKNALILLAQGEKIYYDERLTVETEGKRTWRTWFSQRVGWYYGLLKVYYEHFDDVRRSTNGQWYLAYQYLVYIGVFSLLFHPLKLVALGLLGLSTANGLDSLLGLEWIPDMAATDPAYFLSAYAKYTTLALAALLLSAPRAERLVLLPAVPLYFFYALVHIVPVTVGYLNWFSLRFAGRRIYRDHYGGENGR